MAADPNKDVRTMIAELAKSQQESLEQQRAYNEALRTILSRLTSLCHNGYFTFGGRQWISVSGILEILEGAVTILGDKMVFEYEKRRDGAGNGD